MLTFALMCFDKPGALALRMATRPAHLDYFRQFAPQVRYGGPMVDDADEMCGSLIVIEAADRAAVEAITAGDPYALAGLFERVEIRGLKPALGRP
jgi:hypothetical protein